MAAATGRVPFHEQLYYHVALPRNVPGKEDGNLRHIEEALLNRMLDAVAKLTPHVPSDLASHIRGLRDTLLSCQTLNVDGTIGKSALIREFRALDRQKMLVLHTVPQNCALLVYQQTLPSGEHRVVFEAFETSATADKVLAARSALQWDFPGYAVTIPLKTLDDESFQESLAAFIEQASTESVKKFAAITWKAAATIPEIRDTSDPAIISGLLMTVLEAHGAEAAVSHLRKRVRDTVVFDDARKPWRRSPFYLVLRVAVQRYLYDRLGAELGRLYYKTMMCLLHAQLLEDALKRIPLEAAFSLRQKLGRRLAKLSSDIYNAGHFRVMRSLGNSFESILATTGGYLKAVWRNHRQSRERIVPTLRPRAEGHEFKLRLMNSGMLLRGVLAEHMSLPRPQQRTSAELLQIYEQSVTSVKPYMRALTHQVDLTRYHEEAIYPAKRSSHHTGLRSIELSKVIRDYAHKINAFGNEHPSQKSQMLLHLFELWVLMDTDVVACYPLLQEYHPGFDANILDPIELLTCDETARAQAVRAYLSSRYRSRSGMQSRTIFDDPADDCFAARSYDSEDFQGELSSMREKIEDAADISYAAKEVEWEKKSQLHEQTIEKRNEKECIYDTVQTWDGTESRHRKPCEWHDLHHDAKRIRIRIHEHPLPSYEPATKAALFELQCPEVFAAYRDATWQVLSTLCHQLTEELDRISLVRGYSQVHEYANDTECQVTLGSYRKAHLECHYAEWGFPIRLEEIMRTCGLKPRYYDRLGKVWTSGYPSASLWHHFPLRLPPGSPYSFLQLTYDNWPTSNEIQANQARCPQGLSVHEFTAWQHLLVGSHSRWLTLLRELGSTNLNFSSASTWVLVMRLVFQQGPDSAADPLYPDAHRLLLDDSLCTNLLQQVRYRLEAIRRNWREPVQMEILITILLKITSLSSSSGIQQAGTKLLREARLITGQWGRELRSNATEDPKVIQSAIWAALLCKRTLHTQNLSVDSEGLCHHIDAPTSDDSVDPEGLCDHIGASKRNRSVDPEALRHYIDSSISLQYHLTGDFHAMPYNVRNAIVHDILFAYEHREQLEQSILVNQQIFLDAVGALWHIPDGYDIADLTSVAGTWWLLLSLMSATEEHAYSVHYNYVYGTLLVDGQEMSTLPLRYRSHAIYRHIFGHKNPIVFPSPLRGMEFAFSETMRFGQRIHLGYRNGRLIVRADQAGQLLEFIPAKIFGPDLPTPLVDNCYHWLHVYDGHVEIRQKDPWASKLSNWWVRWDPSGGYFYAVRRFQERAQTTLLEPSSDLVQGITRIFSHFEFPSQILVFASTDSKITVELKRMELGFFVNYDGLLQSPRLGAVVLQNQDAGTWYGLKNKILVQSIANRRQKSILVPSGPIRVLTDGPHVAVEVEMVKEGIYLQYAINDTLGRIDCAPEPHLLHTKALLHAYTSHVIYDPLTKRTGTEEALHLLQTGAYQPWSPLSNVGVLNQIAELSPKRGYYPKDAKCMETVLWNSNCTIYMQDDRYSAVVEKILRRSSELSNFFLDHPTQRPSEPDTDVAYLATRAQMRSSASKNYGQDNVYCSRDKRKSSQCCLNAFEVTKLLQNWHPSCSLETTLISLLHDAPVVGGYDKYYRKCLLTDHLATDIRAEWGALSQKALQCSVQDRFSVTFLLATLAFSPDANLDLLRVLISFAMIPELQAIPAPPAHAAYFHFRADGAPPPSYITSLMDGARLPFSETGFKKRAQLVKAEAAHGPDVDSSCEALAHSIIAQWPDTVIDANRLVPINPKYLDVDRALADVIPEWTRLTRNHELHMYLERVQEVLYRFETQSETVLAAHLPSIAPLLPYPTRVRALDDQSLSNLLQHDVRGIEAPSMSSRFVSASQLYAGALSARSGNVVPRPVSVHDSMSIAPPRRLPYQHRLQTPLPPEIGTLRAIVARFKDPSSFVQCRYAKELEGSIDALQKYIVNRKDLPHNTYPDISTEDITPASKSAAAIAEHIRCALQDSDPQAKWLQSVDLWPRMTAAELLTELRTTSGTKFGKGTKEALVAFGLAISRLQRLLRIQDAQKRRKEQQKRDEWANTGHTNWSPLDYPDWLLLEIDGDILLREEQVQVALATISPESGENSVLQLLMGKGKTSCILPMVAAVLANGMDLARVVVPRALLLQSAQVMQAKLGGLVDRELMHLPFSRKTATTQSIVCLYGKMHARLRDRRGVLIALPEHILSFKLSGLQQLCDEHIKEASSMIEIQRWLDKHTRDVLDECDVSLAIRTQLIYPSGTQMTVDGHPMRWQVTQAVLHLVKDFSSTVQSRYPRSIEIVRRGTDGFPLIYFLRKDAEDYLIELLVKIICKGQTPSIIPCAEYTAAMKQDIQAYISSPSVRSQATSRITGHFREKQALMRTVNLLRGLFVHRILIATLKKRWNVQYGLHPTRVPIAVPFLAKGVPSPTAEWGHPDMAITLTCLSFYYQGLSGCQFKEAFAHLVKTDEPNLQYEKWFPKGINVPKELEDFTTINAEDARQLNELYQVVRTSASLVDFYLNNFVFPKYAKTFRFKLQASGWNLFPSIEAQTGDQVDCRVTGFSGTNDSRHQLPLLVRQRDLPQLAHTNAEVPYYLLASRNRSYVHMAHVADGKRWTELDLIHHLANPPRRPQQQGPIRILIDAGAQVLEHSNRDFAKAWLDADHEATAAVYFDDDHRVWALYRTGKCIPLVASPFVDNLDRCVVYLDESHCRGTDLKFPPYAMAALTLGQHLTKDALVQAAMRLRLLGQTQSVTFFSPPEVHQGILDRLPANTDVFYRPASNDVLRWVFAQTCDTIEQLEPSYFAQTSQYLKQEQARLEHPRYLHDPSSQDTFLATVRIKESLTLKQLYEPKSQRRAGNVDVVSWKPSLQVIWEELQRRKQHFQDRGNAVHASTLEEVEIETERETEREVQTEVENVREVQQALLYNACPLRKLHEDIKHFVTFGRLVAGSDAYRPMFSVLGRTMLGLKHTVNSSMKSGLWISAQFLRTIDLYESNDNYTRSSHWVVWSSISQQALLVSPEEADALTHIMRQEHSYDANGSVHLILYAAPVTRRMLHFNQLDYYAVPALPTDFEAPTWLRVELGLFSGRLYLEWDEYYTLLEYLGLDKNLAQHPEKQAFAKKPLTFLHEWIALRRKGQDFEHTPMGFVTTGKLLTKNHPFFRAFDPSIEAQVARVPSGHPDAAHEDDEDVHDDHEDEEWVPAVEHVDDSEGEDEKLESDDEDDDIFLDAEDGE